MIRTASVSLVLCLVWVFGGATFGTNARHHDTSAEAIRQTGSASGVSLASDPLAEYPGWDRAPRDEQRAGMAVKKANRLLAEAPEAVETVQALLAVAPMTYQAQQRTEDALRVVRAIFEKRPRDMAKTIEAMIAEWPFGRDGARDDRPALRELLETARRRIPDLPREAAADLAYQAARLQSWITPNDNRAWNDALQTVVQQYAGTDAALRAELDLLTRSTQDVFKRVDALARFSAAHRGTCAAAQALRAESVDVGSNIGIRGGATGEDPTERTLRVLEIERQLESKEYARCPATFNRGLSLGVYASKPVYAPGNLDRLIAAYREYFATHLNGAAGDPTDGLGYFVSNPMRKLFEAKGEGVEGLDRFLADLERTAADPGAARYLRALVHEPLSTGNGPGPGPGPSPRTVALLTQLHRTGTGLFQRKALATLAWLYDFYGETRRARECYAEYAREYADSGYVWVAALRTAECAADLGDWKTAASEHQAASRAYAAMPVARTLGYAYGARALEALNDFEHAKAGYQAALAAWDNDYGSRYTIGTRRRPHPSNDWSDAVRDPYEVTPLLLETRVAQLTRALAAPGGAVLERGRWLFDHGKRKEAAALLGDFSKRFPKSPNVPEAQYLAHKARLYDALDMLNVERDTNEAAGLAALEALGRAPYDFPVTAAKITRACVIFKQGKQEEAARIVNEALAECVAHQPVQEPANDIEKDVAAIRSLLFLPTGGAPYAQGGGWNAFSWPATLPPFVVANPQVNVTTADHRSARVTLYQRFPGLANVVLVTDTEVAFFSDMMNSVGGTKKRAWTMDVAKAIQTGVMETPNQPVGPSVDMMKFLNGFFPVRQGHWGGWEFLTYPAIRMIEFMDEGRTRARVSVTIGYSGCDILLEKTGGTWRATGMTNMWIT